MVYILITMQILWYYCLKYYSLIALSWYIIYKIFRSVFISLEKNNEVYTVYFRILVDITVIKLRPIAWLHYAQIASEEDEHNKI